MTEDFLSASGRNCRDKQENQLGEPFLIALQFRIHVHSYFFFCGNSLLVTTEDENTLKFIESRQSIFRNNRLILRSLKRMQADCLKLAYYTYI